MDSIPSYNLLNSSQRLLSEAWWRKSLEQPAILRRWTSISWRLVMEAQKPRQIVVLLDNELLEHLQDHVQIRVGLFLFGVEVLEILDVMINKRHNTF